MQCVGRGVSTGGNKINKDYCIIIQTKMQRRMEQQQASFQTVKNPVTNKISLKHAHTQLARTNPAEKQKSTTCQSIYHGSNKQSIKNLLVATRSRNHYSQSYISMTYDDIKTVIHPKQDNFFTSFFCGLKNQTEEVGCKCGNGGRCPWMDHWLSLSMKSLLYNTPMAHSIPKEVEEQIRKDIKRTQPNSKTFENVEHQQALYQCLTCYARVDPQIGYVQGMNIVCSVLLYHDLNVGECLQAFKYLMMGCGFRQVYLFDFQFAHKLTASLVQALKFRCFDLHRHLIEKYEVNLGIFVIGWILPMLGNIVPLPQMHMVVNAFVERNWEGMLKIIISLLLYLRPLILQVHGETELMEIISIQGLKSRTLPWEEIIMSSQNVKVSNFLSL